MQTAQLSTDGTHQIIILPSDIRLDGSEVYIKKMGNNLVVISCRDPWRSLFESLDQFSDDFMASREQPALEQRESF
jgi:antitoxin VapB